MVFHLLSQQKNIWFKFYFIHNQTYILTLGNPAENSNHFHTVWVFLTYMCIPYVWYRNIRIDVWYHDNLLKLKKNLETFLYVSPNDYMYSVLSDKIILP